ncbi:YggN family protein [Photobacterium japonica]|uniref:hypothetical protein n=1 Tax=Photobacterium japonica TaxID=2910235 RepID=UPI003D0AE0EC
MPYESMHDDPQQHEMKGTPRGGAWWPVGHDMTRKMGGALSRAVCGAVWIIAATTIATPSVQAQPVSAQTEPSASSSPAVPSPVCQLEWHNGISLQDDVLTLDMRDKTFLVKSSGQLYFGIHKVKLNADQMGALADYHAFMRDDLPYTLSRSQLINEELCQRVAARQAKEHEIQSLIPALKRWQTVSITE